MVTTMARCRAGREVHVLWDKDPDDGHPCWLISTDGEATWQPLRLGALMASEMREDIGDVLLLRGVRRWLRWVALPPARNVIVRGAKDQQPTGCKS
jgi:hypothetical protein